MEYSKRGRLADGAALDLLEERGQDVELDEGQTQLLAPHDALHIALGRGFGRRGRVGIDAHLVAVLAAQELVAGHAVHLAHQVPQRDLDARDAAALAAPVAELLDGAEDHVHVAGVLAQEHALELERILRVPRVAHLADAVDALVGVDAHDRIVIVAAHHGQAHVGDLEIGRAGIGVDRVLNPCPCVPGLQKCWTLQFPFNQRM